MSNQIDVLAFGPLYLDFLTIQNRKVELLYGGERVLHDYRLTKDGFVLEDIYDDRGLKLRTYGGIEHGRLALQVDDEETECTYTTDMGGGTTNFAVQLNRLGLNSFLIGKISRDRYGNRLRNLLQNACEFYSLETDATQTLSINIIDPETGEFASIVTGSSNRELHFREIDALLQELLLPNQFLCTGGFFKMRQLFPHYSQIFRKARELGCEVVLDHGRFLGRPNSLEYKEAVDVVKDALQYVDIYLPNESEITELTGNNNLEYALRSAQDLGPKFIICKRGANGCSFITSEDSKIHNVPQEHKPRKVFHTIGAGDSFNAGFIKGRREGLDVESASRLGNATAYLKITTGERPTYLEVRQLLG